jgi:predicted nuclease with TOPRIM domain
MNIQEAVARIEDRVKNTQGSETIVPKEELITFIEQGEQQLQGLFGRIKTAERKVALLEDRVSAQRDTINRLESQLSKAQSKRK